MLPTYIQVLIYLISLEWGPKSENLMRYLKETVVLLRKPGAIAALGGLLNMIASKGGQIIQNWALTPASYNYQTIIRHMVALKYGVATPAEKALGQFRAATKKGEEFSGSRDYIGKCGVSNSPELNCAGPDAHAYLEEIADEHEGGFEHSQEYLDELMEKISDRKLPPGRSLSRKTSLKKVSVPAPSFSKPGTFEKVRETISRSGLAPPNQLLQRQDTGDEDQRTYRYSTLSAPWRDGSLSATAFADPDSDGPPLGTEERRSESRWSEELWGPVPASGRWWDCKPLSSKFGASVFSATALDHLAASAEGSVQQFTAGLKTILPDLPKRGSSFSNLALASQSNSLSSRLSMRTWTTKPDSLGSKDSSASELPQTESPKSEVSYSLAATRRDSSCNITTLRVEGSSPMGPRMRPRRHSEKQISFSDVSCRRSSDSLSSTSNLGQTSVETASKAARRPSLHVDMSHKFSNSMLYSPSGLSSHQAQYQTTVTGAPSGFSSPVGRPTVPGLNLKAIRLNSNSESQVRGSEAPLQSSKSTSQLILPQGLASVSVELPSPPVQESPGVTPFPRRNRFSSTYVL
eukprot:gene14535-20573_t